MQAYKGEGVGEEEENFPRTLCLLPYCRFFFLALRARASLFALCSTNPHVLHQMYVERLGGRRRAKNVHLMDLLRLNGKGRGLKFSREGRTFEVNKFIAWLFALKPVITGELYPWISQSERALYWLQEQALSSLIFVVFRSLLNTFVICWLTLKQSANTAITWQGTVSHSFEQNLLYLKVYKELLLIYYCDCRDKALTRIHNPLLR